MNAMLFQHNIADATLTKTTKMGVLRMVPFVECVLVLKGSHVIPWTNSMAPLSHGVCLILAIGTTTGQGYMAGWNGMASSQQQ